MIMKGDSSLKQCHSVPHCLKSEEELSYSDLVSERRVCPVSSHFEKKEDYDLLVGLSEKMKSHFKHHRDHIFLKGSYIVSGTTTTTTMTTKSMASAKLTTKKDHAFNLSHFNNQNYGYGSNNSNNVSGNNNSSAYNDTNPAENPVIIYRDGLKISHLSTNPVNIYWCDVAKKCTLSVIAVPSPQPILNPKSDDDVLLPELGHFIRTFAARTNLSHLTVVVSLIYMDRLKKLLPTNAHGENGTQHRLFVAASLTASKFLHDISSLSARMVAYACRGLYSLSEISRMELEFLRLINYRLHVTRKDIEKYLNQHDCLFTPALISKTT